ncbi:uncharacterized protein EAE98_003106 [Botrytis deweyae]|uniref:BTB domain-containing protein n=1 Tax=Botrytis deweyae TaxID=2478750 RepID=A0ABQ7IVL9_9HELO|nr:uncharacterized protein EAE98_003106 [Botrytis deweyae]KAF7935061.1 hypothetical protein EAE98_003106 [Botrytis deweyae]
MSLKRSGLPLADEEHDDEPFKEPWTPFSDELGSEMVRVLIGKNSHKKVFHVHKNILFDKIPCFKELSNNNRKIVEFPHHVPSTFDVLLEWVHTDCLRGIEIIGGDKHFVQYRSWDLLCLYQLAEELLLPELMDRVMELHRRLDAIYCVSYDPTGLKRIYERTAKTSKFRQYCAEKVAYVVRNKAEKDIPTPELLSAMDNKDLAGDYLSISRRVTIEDPSKGSGCRFHMHDKSEKCLAKDRRGEVKVTILSHEQIKKRRIPPAKKPRLSKSPQES